MCRRLPFFSGRLRHVLLPNTTNPLRPISVFPILHPPLSSPRRFSSSTLSRDDGVSLCCQMWIDNFRHPDRVVTSISPLLRRFDLWLLAYQKVATDDTGSYVPRSSISTSTLQDLLALRNAVLDGKFKWGARLKFFVKSPRDKTVAAYLWYIKADFSVLLDGMKVGLVINAVMRDVRDKLIVDLIKDALVTPVVVTTLEKKEKKKKRKYQKKRGTLHGQSLCTRVVL
ncbi:Nuclear intron maturase [Vigna angularis]|uniref:Nuclear intron maturase n=1 Tax=Phaseolus angularis TaxID=3914 RepID=A0A8T0LDI0_PHAAN|nr:Nuclear intron maturase [Vigna angularis]